jgi:hypothetical protein
MTKEETDKINTERIEKLIYHSKASSEKYVYYLLAIDAASVAFSINQSKDLTLTFYQIPLALAVIFWGWSFYSGLMQAAKFERYTDLNVIQLKSKLYGVDFQQKLNSEYEIMPDLMKLYRKNQNTFFAIGAIFFVLWHVLRMYQNC